MGDSLLAQFESTSHEDDLHCLQQLLLLQLHCSAVTAGLKELSAFRWNFSSGATGAGAGAGGEWQAERGGSLTI